MTPPIEYGTVIRLSPLVRRITQNNPGLYPGPGTNTHLIGTDDLVILDPGEDRDDGHLDRIVAAVGAARVGAVIPSHGHPDHWPLATKLAARVEAPIGFFGSHPGFRTDWSLGDGDRVTAGRLTLAAVHTPGHLGDHLSFLLEDEGALFPGDVVMGWSSSIIAPPEGDLGDYLRSLDRLEAIPNLTVGYPAHGPAVTQPYHRIRELRAHRAMRTRQVLEALDAGPSTIAAMVATIYRDIDPGLHPGAALSVRAHLLHLERDRVVRHSGGGPGWESAVWERIG